MRNISLRNIVLIILTVILYNCKRDNNNPISFKKINGSKVLICDVDKITETKEMKLSQLVESSRFIPLSNNPQALIGNTWLEESTLGYFVLADFNNKLFIFDNNGQYLNSWSPGKGPNEFILPSQPQVVGQNLYIKDIHQNKLLKYDINNQFTTSVKLSKSTGSSIVLNDSTIMTVGNSESNQDPFLICVQDFNGKTLKSIKAAYQISLVPPLVQDKVICFPIKNGWNIHFPENDTLMYYKYIDNELIPVAVFNSTKHIQTNRELYLARKNKGLEISDRNFTQTIKVIPEYESTKYFFLSVYYFGLNNDLPWYFAERKICLVDKDSQEAFFVNIVDDFWGNKPFTFSGNSKIWSKVLIKSSPIISVKEQFKKELENIDELGLEQKEKLQNIVSDADENDNSAIFEYILK